MPGWIETAPGRRRDSLRGVRGEPIPLPPSLGQSRTPHFLLPPPPPGTKTVPKWLSRCSRCPSAPLGSFGCLLVPSVFNFGRFLGCLVRESVLGGPVATILPLGCPWRPFGSLLELSWAPAALTALWGSLWSFGSVLCLRCEASKVWVLDQLGTARAPLYSFWGVFCAREASCWVPWCP